MHENFGEYSRFTQKFIQVIDELNGMAAEKSELKDDGEPIPAELEKEMTAYTLTAANMVDEGIRRFGKDAKELINDGWKFWMAEDVILRERRYGKK